MGGMEECGFWFLGGYENLMHVGNLEPKNVDVSEVFGLERCLIPLYRPPQHAFGVCDIEHGPKAKESSGTCWKDHRFGAE